MASVQEPELLRSRELLQAIIKDVPDAILLTNAHRQIVVVNAAAERIFGYARDELVGQSTMLLYRDRTDFERQGAERFAGPRRVDGERLELQLRRRSGELFDAEAIVTGIGGASGTRIGYLGIVRDVTARNAVAAELRETRRRLADAVEALYEGLVIFDAQDRVILRNGRFKELYPIAGDILEPGIRYEDALREAVRQGQFDIPAGQEETWLAQRIANFRSPAQDPLETRLPDDRWTLVSTRRTTDGGTVASYFEITRRKRLEAALTELTQVSASSEGRIRERICAGLAVGARYLGLSTGLVGTVASDSFTIMFASPSLADLQPGTVFDLDRTHAKPIVETGCGFDFVGCDGSEAIAPPLRCKAFIGAPLHVDGVMSAMIGFFSSVHRAHPFDETERRFLAVLADWVGGKIARMRHEEHRLELEAELVRLATTDELTGIANRRALLGDPERAVAQARRYGRPLTLALADLDHFKSVNDLYGHPVGDAALRLFTRVVGEELRSVDLFGRMGGEEFCLVLPETDRAGGLALMDRIGASLRRRDMAVDGASIRITASFGLAQCTPEDMLDDLLREADAALYDAKRRGRDRAVAR